MFYALRRGSRGMPTTIAGDRAEHRDTNMTTPIQTAAARLIDLVRAGLADPSVARTVIACAAVELMDCAARPSQGDDPAVVHLADQFAERAALWAYGRRYRDFRRADDEMKLRNALRSCWDGLGLRRRRPGPRSATGQIGLVVR